MLRIVAVLMVLLAAAPSRASNTVSVSWEEFQAMYRESVEREIMEKIPEEKEKPVYTVEEAVYRLKIEERKAVGQVLISGR